jgi:acyl-CoA dehydrogenase family protein 9
MGIRASDTRPVAFENVIVPAADRLGEVGQGFKIALEVLNSGRLGLACAAAHGTRSIMRRALEYANTRTQFGKPIGSFEILQRKIAANAATCYALDAACFITAHMMDRGGIDYSLETAICKVAGAELVFRAANDALQIAGGIGYSAEFPYEQAVRDARINLIFEGTDEILRILIALSGLQEPGERLKAVGEAFQRPLQSIGTIGSYLADRAKHTIDRPKLTHVHSSLSHEAGLVSTMVHDFARGVESAIMHHGKQIIDRQIIQERMADVAIDVYLATAALSRASATIARTDLSDEAKASEVDCAKLFVSMAAGRARHITEGLRDNDDDLTRAVAARALTQQELIVPAILGI